MTDTELVLGFISAAGLWSAWLLRKPRATKGADFSHFAVDRGGMQWQTK